jgi:hypothetical protein
VRINSSCIVEKWKPSEDLKAYTPLTLNERTTALYFASAEQAGLGSLKTATWPGSMGKSFALLAARTILFLVEPSNSMRPRSGLVQWIPSRLSA